MSIHRHNYEAYFLDYLEDRLTAEERAEVEAFVLIHADLKAELECLQDGMEQTLSPTAVYPFKESLRKEEIPVLSQCEEFLLKELDGALTEEEGIEWENLKREDTSLRESSAYFPHTIIRPEEIFFDYKHRLKFDEFALNENDSDTLLAKALEGDLSTEERARLFAQMANDEALQRSWLYMQQTRLPRTSEATYTNEHLKMTAVGGAEWLAVAVAEGDAELPLSQATADVMQAEVNLYRKMRLRPLDVEFPDKKALRRRSAAVISLVKYWAYTAAAAAVVSIAWFGLSSTSVSSSMAHHKGLYPSVPLQQENRADKTDQVDIIRVDAHKGDHSFMAQESFPKDSESVIDSVLIVPVHIPMDQEELPIAEAPVVVPVPAQSPSATVASQQSALAAASASGARPYMTIWQFATDKAKSTLWGSDDYPKDAFATALVQKELRKRASGDNKASSNEVESIETNGKKKTRIKLGKLEFERTRLKK